MLTATFVNNSIQAKMKKNIVLGIVLLCVWSSKAEAQKSEPLKWLVGSWKINTGNGAIVERWNWINDSTFQGKSFFVKDPGDSSLQETLELSFRKGNWTYQSLAYGQNNNQVISFPVIYVGKGEFISENPTHDFPQRIAYRRSKNNLFASIEGKRKGRYAKQNFDFILE
jgi:hypothetical protein